MRMPCGTSTILVSSLSIAMTEVSSPLWVYLRPIRSIMPWTVPSSPGVPWSALKTTSGLSSASRAATSRSMSSSVTFDQPRSRKRVGDALAAGQRDFALGRPAAHQDDDVDVLVHSVPTRWISHSRVMWVFAFDPAPDFLAQRLDLGARRATEIEQEIAMLFRDLGIADASARGSPPRRPAPRPCGRAGS